MISDVLSSVTHVKEYADSELHFSLVYGDGVYSWTGETVELPLDEDKFLEELNKRRATSRRKEDVNVTFSTEGTYGTPNK